MTSEYPYPGQPGPDGSPQGDAYDAPPRSQYPQDGQFTPFAAFGGADEEPPAPPRASARASVRMPPGLVVSSPDAAGPPPTPPQRGGVYGGSGGGAVYGSASPPAPAEYGQQPGQPGTYGAPDNRVYGRPYGEAEPAQQYQAEPAQQYQGEPAQQYQPAPPVASPPNRPAVPMQRSGSVYGQQRAPESEVAQQQPQPHAPAWQPDPQGPQWQPDNQPPAWQPAPPQRPAYPVQEPQYAGQEQPYPSQEQQRQPYPNDAAQFEQHGRRTQAPGGYSESPSQRSISWQDQLQPLVANPEPARPQAPSRPMAADISGAPVPPRSKLRIVGYVLIVLIVVGLGGGALYYTSRTDPPKVGSCVTQSGAVAVNVSCSTSGAFKVTQKVAKASDCQDYLNEPSLSYTEGGKDVVLCLQPANQ